MFLAENPSTAPKSTKVLINFISSSIEISRFSPTIFDKAATSP